MSTAREFDRRRFAGGLSGGSSVLSIGNVVASRLQRCLVGHQRPGTDVSMPLIRALGHNRRPLLQTLCGFNGATQLSRIVEVRGAAETLRTGLPNAKAEPVCWVTLA